MIPIIAGAAIYGGGASLLTYAGINLSNYIWPDKPDGSKPGKKRKAKKASAPKSKPKKRKQAQVAVAPKPAPQVQEAKKAQLSIVTAPVDQAKPAAA